LEQEPFYNILDVVLEEIHNVVRNKQGKQNPLKRQTR